MVDMRLWLLWPDYLITYPDCKLILVIIWITAWLAGYLISRTIHDWHQTPQRRAKVFIKEAVPEIGIIFYSVTRFFLLQNRVFYLFHMIDTMNWPECVCVCLSNIWIYIFPVWFEFLLENFVFVSQDFVFVSHDFVFVSHDFVFVLNDFLFVSHDFVFVWHDFVFVSHDWVCADGAGGKEVATGEGEQHLVLKRF